MSGMGVVYALCDPRTGEVRYVGKTARSVHARVRAHTNGVLRGGSTHKDNWLRSIDCKPRVTVLALGLSEQLDDLERRWIAALRTEGAPLTNLTDGGEGVLGNGRVLTDGQIAVAADRYRSGESLEQIAQSLGCNHVTVWEWLCNAGVKMRPPSQLHAQIAGGRAAGPITGAYPKSAETRAKISASLRGRTYAEMGRRPISEETKQKIGNAQRGRACPRPNNCSCGFCSGAAARARWGVI